MSGDDYEPILRYLATQSSLDLAEKIAEELGVEFKREEVAKLSENMEEQIFADLVAALDLNVAEFNFKSGVYSKAQAFAAPSSDESSYVVVDMVFDFWLLGITHVSTVTAAKILDIEQQNQIGTVADELFWLLTESHRFKSVRETFLPLMLEHGDCLNLSGALSRSMTIFIVCHEIAHCRLDHLSQPPSPQIEFDADRLATEYFAKITGIKRNHRENTAFVDEKVAAAPIILMQLFAIYETWLEAHGFSTNSIDTHPRSSERAERVRELLLPKLNDKAKYILDGFANALRDLQDLIEKKRH